MEESLTADGAAADEAPKRVKQFGEGPTALLSFNFSTRFQVILLCMFATGTSLMARSLPFTTTVGDAGMAVQYGWDEADVGNFYAAFGWGYAISQIPGSMAAQQWGHKNVWLIAIAGAGVCNMFVPWAAEIGLWPAMACRFVFGLFQGSLFPVQTGIKAAWLHENERSTLNAIIGLCWAFFQAIQSIITPYFMTGIGWQWAFVFYSLLIFIWSYYWNKYGVGIVPGQVERCTKEEAAYLQGREIPEVSTATVCHHAAV